MGPKASTNSNNVKTGKDEINKNQFEFLYVIGKGGFGKVWKVQSKKLKKQYALKEMSKAKIIDKKSEKSIKYERELLSRLKNPFIVNMQYAFQDYENLYLVMDLLLGGDLRYHISRHKRFSEEQTRFFVACILLGLEFLHNNNVLHRDIKPENLVLDERGYVRITDFGIAKLYQKENSSETSGTPGYMSPEVMCAQNHTIAVDYFAVGVIAYEFMNGRRPYVGKSRKEIKDMIMAKQVQVKPTEIPEGWSEEAADFINKLLQRKPAHRLGIRGAAEVKDHPWLKYYPWQELYDKTLEAPFVPRVGDNFDRKYCESQDKIGNSTLERYQKYMRDENFPHVFRNFTYINYLEVGAEVGQENTPTSNNLNGLHGGVQTGNGVNQINQNNYNNHQGYVNHNMNNPSSSNNLLKNTSMKNTGSLAQSYGQRGEMYNRSSSSVGGNGLLSSNSSSTNKLSQSSNQKKYTINLLKNKVKIVDNSTGVNSSNMTASTSMKDVNSNSKISSSSSSNNLNKESGKIAQNVNNFYNNYINSHHQRSTSQIIVSNMNSNSLSQSSGLGSNNAGNVAGSSKYTPYRDKKLISAGSESSKDQKEFSIINKQNSIGGSINSNNNPSNVSMSPNMVSSKAAGPIGPHLGSTSSTNIFQNRNFNPKLPNINSIDKLKLTKKLSGSSSTASIFKYNSKQSTNSQSSTGSSIGSTLKFFNK